MSYSIDNDRRNDRFGHLYIQYFIHYSGSDEGKDTGMVLKTMSSNDVKQRWGSVMRTVDVPDDAVIVESHGTPKAAVISFERFQKLRELEKMAQRERALNTLREIEARYDGRNDDLTEEQIEEIAVRAGREINRAAAERQRKLASQRTE